MKAYAEDLRVRVLRAVEQGYPRAEIVKLLGISLATLKRYLKQQRELGHVNAKTIPGRQPRKLAALQADLLRQMQTYADVILERHCELWKRAHGIQVSLRTVSEAIKRVGWTRKKKSLAASERNEEERATWRKQMSQQEADRLIFLDECGSNIALTLLYARARHPENAPEAVFPAIGART